MDNKSINILLVEDNPGDVVIIQEMIKEIHNTHFIVETADRIDDALRFLQEMDLDILLLDLNLLDSEGIETFTIMNENAPNLPIIILTGIYDEELAINAVGEGAQDYLIKGQINSQLLARSIRYSLERKNIERKLRESEEKYRIMVEKIDSGVILINSQNELSYVNMAMANMLGYTISEMVNKHISHFTDKNGESKIKQHLVDVKGGSGKVYEVELISKNGSNVYVLMVSSPLFKKDGEYIGAISIMTDISARKDIEKSLMDAMVEKNNYFFLIMNNMLEAMKPLIQPDEIEDHSDKFT
ncbi:MAG TPA: PAS domain S-box protein [Methanobacteriaceae archaeon]|nr:PAS domain S-box protein [Methanobacteriaceae archaeon]